MDVVVFVNPITGQIETMPVEMIGAYLPNSADLDLETAAKIAAIRDDEAANNLLFSIGFDEHLITKNIAPPEFVPA